MFWYHRISDEAPVDGLTVTYPWLFTNIWYVLIFIRLVLRSITYDTIIRNSTRLTF